MGLWSDAGSWPGAVPIAGEDVTIPLATTITLDVDTPELGSVTVLGTLDAVDTKSVSLSCEWMLIDGGTVEFGTSAAKRTNELTITLTGARGTHTQRSGDGALDNDAIQRAIRIINSGTFEMHSDVSGIQETKLNADCAASATSFTTADDISHWNVGDKVAFGTTDFFGVQNGEVLEIATVGTTSFTTTAGITSARYGSLQYVQDQTPGSNADGYEMSLTQGTVTKTHANLRTVVDERAYIINLTRKIKVTAKNDTDWSSSGFGFHIMSHTGTTVRAQGVELHRGGQRNAMGRYPWHWHMWSWRESDGAFLGQAAADQLYLRDSSVWESENRACTLHGVWGAELSDVKIFDIKGHAVFMEDGSEKNNTIQDCTVIKARDPGAGNRPKLHDQNAAGFWFTNYTNTILRNKANDCQRGVWGAIAQTRPFGLSSLVEVVPLTLPLTLWEDNEGSCCEQQGILSTESVTDEEGNTSGTKWIPSGNQTFTRGTIWKCGRDIGYQEGAGDAPGGYANRVRFVTYDSWQAIDNQDQSFQGATEYPSSMLNPLVVGHSLNEPTAHTTNSRCRAFASYHHTIDIVDAALVNLPGSAITSGNKLTVAAGAFATSDFYTLAVSKGMKRNSGWAFGTDVSMGLLARSPRFDGFPIDNGGGPNRKRHWTVAGAVWDPHGYWQPTANKWLVPNETFYSNGLSDSVAVDESTNDFLSTSTEWIGFHSYRPDYDDAEYGGGFVDITCTRYDPTTKAFVADHVTGPPAESHFFARFKFFALQNEGLYTITLPGEALPTTSSRCILHNCYEATNWVVLALPFDGTVPAASKQESGESNADQPGEYRVHSMTGTSIQDVIDDATAVTAYQDTANDLVYVKAKGGLDVNIYNYNPANENDKHLYQHQRILVYPSGEAPILRRRMIRHKAARRFSRRMRT